MTVTLILTETVYKIKTCSK